VILEPLIAEALAVRVIPNVDRQLAAELGLTERHRAVGMITANIDDALYASLDEGTKFANVDVVYAKSFYAGAAHASGPYSGEIIGIYAGPDEEEVTSAMRACLEYMEKRAWFYSANDDNSLAFFPHVLPSTGNYLSAAAGVQPGTPMAYLIAPPLEATLAIDAALKVADVAMKVFYAPPSETNFAGALLTGELAEVEAAAAAFQEAVLDLAARPNVVSPSQNIDLLTESFARSAATKGTAPSKPFRLLDSGLELDEKPDGYTHLFDNLSLVPKGHAAVRFRGKMDLLQAQVIDAAVAVGAEGHRDVADELSQLLSFLRTLMSSEVLGRPMPALAISGFSEEEMHRISHHTTRYLNVGWVLPDPSMGFGVAKLNLLRAQCREVEMSAMDAYGTDPGHLSAENRDAMLHSFNRLSNIIYVLTCKLIGRIKS
jgi:ethanolamine utilization protein EutL